MTDRTGARRIRRLSWLGALVVVGLSRPVVAQQGPRPVPAAAHRVTGADSIGAVMAPSDAATRRAPLWAPIASFVIPGAGQIAMRQPRAAAYLGVEIYELLRLYEESRNVNRLVNEFHRTAREVARAPLFGGPLPDAPWRIYEGMEEFTESGRFSLAPGGAIVPEPDATTFNGSYWLKARTIYWADPDVPPPVTDSSYKQAIAYYVTFAAGDDYRWSWRNAEIMYNGYKETIARKNRAAKDVRATFGLIVANHLLSGIDAFAAVKLRRSVGANGEKRYEVVVPFEQFGKRSPKSR